MLAAKSPRFQATACKQWLRMYRGVDVAHASVLWDPDVFGHDRSCLRKFAKIKSARKVLELPPTCGPCRRNPNYSYSTKPGSYTKQILSFCDRQGIECLLSTELEHQIRFNQLESVYAKQKKIWPYKTVDNPIPGFGGISTDYFELHGKHASCPNSTFIADLDGDDIGLGSALQEWLSANKYCEYVRVWRKSWQGIGNTFVAPNRRNYVIPSRDVILTRNILRRLNNGKSNQE